MSAPVAFEIASFSLYSQAPFAAGERSAFLLLVNAEGQADAAARRLAGGADFMAAAKAAGLKAAAFSYCCALMPQSGGAAEGAAGAFHNVILVNAAGAENFGEEYWLKLGGACAKAARGFDRLVLAGALPPAGEGKGGPLSEEALAHLLCGFKLGHYRFDKYKTAEKNKAEAARGIAVTLLTDSSDKALRALDKAQIIAESVILARNLVNEPANILGTEQFAAHIRNLRLLGVEVDILDKAALEEAGLNALLAVAQGSRRPPYLAVMQWHGGADDAPPLAFIGKGVVFDSGGISIKPGAKMEDMKGDMGGAAAVVGAIHALAARKAKANIVGIVGLVENMPDAGAQRPGDIITSLSGQTIEVINTDAEGRLVLADALCFAERNFKPKLMIDLATLTGAVMVALGHNYAAVFANDRALSAQLAEAGEATGERLWPMPLDPAYDKLVDSKFADMRNSCGREAGAITAAQFLQRFVGSSPWAHLDIAGVAFGAEETEYNASWATGFGVRLLNRFVAQFHESRAEAAK